MWKRARQTPRDFGKTKRPPPLQRESRREISPRALTRRSLPHARRRSQRAAATAHAAGALPVPVAAKGATFMSPVFAHGWRVTVNNADLGDMGSGAGIALQSRPSKISCRRSRTKQRTKLLLSRRCADAMRRSWTRRAFNNWFVVNLEPVLQDRQSRDPKPGPGLYAVRALALALAETPGAAAKLIGKSRRAIKLH